MTTSIQDEHLHDFVLKCVQRQLHLSDFLNLYKEFYNEKYSINVENGESETVTGANFEISNQIADDLVKLLNSGASPTIAEYLVGIIFVNYNSELIKAFFPKLGMLTDQRILIHFFSKAAGHFSRLTDKLLIDELNKDIAGVIVPGIFDLEMHSSQKDLIVSMFKFLQSVLNLASGPIVISSPELREKTHLPLSRLSNINKMLYRRVIQTIEAKIIYKEGDNALKEVGPEFIGSPSITSPQSMPTPLSSLKTPTLVSENVEMKYKDLKLLRYYKNLWLNSKIMSWESASPDILSRYSSIPASLFQDTANINQNADSLLTDLVDTSFTCFAQFVSNKQYHQTNSNLNLLERQWLIFISKHLPLLILEHSSRNPSIVTDALQNIDTKVIKAIKGYYSERDDPRGRNEDLFDDYPASNLDIRHEFIKSLIMLGLQPPTLINEFLRDDQAIDPRTLITTDQLVVPTPQGTSETIQDIPSFLRESLDSLEYQYVGKTPNTLSNGLYQLLWNFESVSPTKQRVVSIEFYNILNESITSLNYGRIIKLCALLSFNFSHSLTSILSFCGPNNLAELLVKFVDVTWQDAIRVKKSDGDDDTEEDDSVSLSFSWSLLLLITLVNIYGVQLSNVILNSDTLTLKDSFAIKFISSLPSIEDNYTVDEKNRNDPQVQNKSHKIIQEWMSDLFIKGSIPDSLVKGTDAKQLAIITPFIFREVVLALEVDAVENFNNIIGGLEYFLQPFMLSGLIKIVYWLEGYLLLLQNDSNADKIIQNIFTILNTIFNPNTLNEDSQPFHTAILRLNGVKLLKLLRKFRRQNQSNYGVYSSDGQEQPILETLIGNLVHALGVSPVYNIDSRIINSDSMNSQQNSQGYEKFSILNENPVNKMVANQINSFWNLHSSTYYNLDYLCEIIRIVTPERFLFDALETLDYKLSTYGVPAARNKMLSAEVNRVLDYFFYFLVLFDCANQSTANNMIKLFEKDKLNSEQDNGDYQHDSSNDEQPKNEDYTQVKQENGSIDDDIGMLFGENEGNSHLQEDEVPPVGVKKLEMGDGEVHALHRDSFGIIIDQVKKLDDLAYKNNYIRGEDYERFCGYYDRYLKVLKTCVF